MATLEVHDDQLVVRLSPLERLAALHGDVRVPLSSVEAVGVEPEPWCALRGIRLAGTGIPGVAAYGVRAMTGDRPDFAAVSGRQPAVRVDLGPEAQFGHLLVTVADPVGTVRALRPGQAGA